MGAWLCRACTVLEGQSRMAVDSDPDDEREARVERLVRRAKDALGENDVAPTAPKPVPVSVRLKPDRRKATR